MVILSLCTFLSTLFGGIFSIKNKDNLHKVMGFTAGVLVGVVFFEIFPEIIVLINENGYDTTGPMIALVLGFLVFHILEKTILIHHSHEGDYSDHKHPKVGIFSALALAGHSFMDGVGIGLGFQVSPTIGVLVAIAVIAHDFTDGMNTVALVLSNKNSLYRAKWLLLLDAIAPVLGALSTNFFQVPTSFLVLYLGFFAGFLLYIGASDILPEAHSKESSLQTILLTILGIAVIFLVSRLA